MWLLYLAKRHHIRLREIRRMNTQSKSRFCPYQPIQFIQCIFHSVSRNRHTGNSHSPIHSHQHRARQGCIIIHPRRALQPYPHKKPKGHRQQGQQGEDDADGYHARDVRVRIGGREVIHPCHGARRIGMGEVSPGVVQRIMAVRRQDDGGTSS